MKTHVSFVVHVCRRRCIHTLNQNSTLSLEMWIKNLGSVYNKKHSLRPGCPTVPQKRILSSVRWRWYSSVYGQTCSWSTAWTCPWRPWSSSTGERWANAWGFSYTCGRAHGMLLPASCGIHGDRMTRITWTMAKNEFYVLQVCWNTPTQAERTKKKKKARAFNDRFNTWPYNFHTEHSLYVNWKNQFPCSNPAKKKSAFNNIFIHDWLKQHSRRPSICLYASKVWMHGKKYQTKTCDCPVF